MENRNYTIEYRCAMITEIDYNETSEQPQEENFHWECFFYDGSSYMLPPRSNEKLFIRVEGTKLMVDENTWFDANTLEWVEDGEVVTTESGQIWGQVD